MKKIIGLALIALGCFLLYYGYEASQSVASELKQAIDGTPTDESRNYTIGGAAAVIVGLAMVFINRGKS